MTRTTEIDKFHCL